jgi:hypothetical protein
MELSRRVQGLVLVACLVLSGCNSRVDGDYQLDLEQTKACVAKSAAADPEAGKHKDEVIKLLDATQVSIRLDPSGKMLSTTVLTVRGGPSTSKTSGTWKLDGKRVTIKVKDDPDTLCDVDGPRLRCQRATDQKLFGSYVLVHK